MSTLCQTGSNVFLCCWVLFGHFLRRWFWTLSRVKEMNNSDCLFTRVLFLLIGVVLAPLLVIPVVSRRYYLLRIWLQRITHSATCFLTWRSCLFDGFWKNPSEYLDLWPMRKDREKHHSSHHQNFNSHPHHHRDHLNQHHVLVHAMMVVTGGTGDCEQSCFAMIARDVKERVQVRIVRSR